MVFKLSRLLRGGRTHSVLLCSVAASLICLALPQGTKDAVSGVLSGIALGPFKRLATAVVEITNVRDENRLLRKLAAEIMEERQRFLEYKHENERLRELLSHVVSFDEEERLEMLPARVIGMPGTRVVERIEIDKGSTDGIELNMAVIVADGLVGKVESVFFGRSIIEPLSSPTSGVSAVIERSRVRGLVRPKYGRGAELLGWGMNYIPARSDIKPDDLIATSGLGGIYPAGLVIGSVSSVKEGPLTMDVDVTLAVDISALEQVFILTGKRVSPGERSARERELMRDIGSRLSEGTSD